MVKQKKLSACKQLPGRPLWPLAILRGTGIFGWTLSGPQNSTKTDPGLKFGLVFSDLGLGSHTPYNNWTLKRWQQSHSTSNTPEVSTCINMETWVLKKKGTKNPLVSWDVKPHVLIGWILCPKRQGLRHPPEVLGYFSQKVSKISWRTLPWRYQFGNTQRWRKMVIFVFSIFRYLYIVSLVLVDWCRLADYFLSVKEIDPKSYRFFTRCSHLVVTWSGD